MRLQKLDAWNWELKVEGVKPGDAAAMQKGSERGRGGERERESERWRETVKGRILQLRNPSARLAVFVDVASRCSCRDGFA